MSDILGETNEYHPRSTDDLEAQRKEVSVVLLTRGRPDVVTKEERTTIEKYLSKYARKGAKQGIEFEMGIMDLASLSPKTKHLVIDRAYTQQVDGMTEAFRMMREQSPDAVDTIKDLERQSTTLLERLCKEAEEGNFVLDWSGFTPTFVTPGRDPDRTFLFAADAPHVPAEIAQVFKYIEALNLMLSKLMVEYIDTLLTKEGAHYKTIQSTLQQIAENKFNYSGPNAARDMIRDFGWNMWRTQASHYSISLPQDDNGLVCGALVKSENNLHIRYDFLNVLSATGDMAFGKRLTAEDDRGRQLPQISTRSTIRHTLPSSQPPGATAPDRKQFDVQSKVCFDGGANHFDRSGGEIVITIDGKQIILGPMHSSYRPRVTTSVDTLKTCMEMRKKVRAEGGGDDDVRNVALQTPVRFEDTSPGATLDIFRANLFRIALQHILHQAALIAASEGETDIYKWLEKEGVLKAGTAAGLYDFHTTDRGMKSQMDAVVGKLDTQKLDELSILIGVLKGKMGKYLEKDKTIDQVPHLQQIFDYAERGIATLRKVEEDIYSKRDEFLLQKQKVINAFERRRQEGKPMPKGIESPAAFFYRWYERNDRIAAYSNFLTNTEIATMLLDIFDVRKKIKIDFPDGTAYEFQLDDKIWELWEKGERATEENDFNTNEEVRAVLLTFLYHYHVDRKAKEASAKAAQAG